MSEAEYLPIIFAGLMALAVIVYAILDGYDLGVGILFPLDDTHQRDVMIASIGPFWDANETWLVLGIGILLIAFPEVYNTVFHHLYLPTAIMLAGLIARGVAFDFRSKSASRYHYGWDKVFKIASIVTSVSQGYMLGMYVAGFEQTTAAYCFAILSGFGVACAYSYIGACWLVMKTEGELQKRAANWARKAGYATALGVVAVSLFNPWVNVEVYDFWFSMPAALLLLMIPLICAVMFVINDRLLRQIPLPNDFACWVPFTCAIVIFLCSAQALAVGFYPYLIPGKVTIFQAASAPESLRFVLYGAVIVVPVILIYTFFVYWVFWGKATKLKYY
ncbi:Cytochrome bd-I ubiquinol oxidase subunit 2 [BD1-7 clade bacterium]|uniref:Cytochrome bd-I ubiquinol oxidase subunit 2 n=1 Tax=BD1-7 clade bacterium TaxID=2029982 RepID=A0A5S9QYK5_9GAMM|nr:Cytochrome bd-I ubiquinol oxidase subunit 2 [BD1-7 clade bacterium]